MTEDNNLKKDYSKTLNIPKPDAKDPAGVDTNASSIPQRANLPKREPEILEFWKNHNVYEESLKAESNKGTFILHDGPPFSNGNIHIGHAFNKILKDVITKARSMEGYVAPYVPGWDNNGLPIEVLVAKEFREKKHIPTRKEIRDRCREVAVEWVGKQSEQFQRLGIRGDWDHPYLTMLSKMAAKELDVFANLVEKGYVYRGLRPVQWSLVDETALAESEIEYEDRMDPSIYVRFALRSDPGGIFGPDQDLAHCYTVIWTTTPWTIPANVAIAAGPEIDYVIVRHEGNKYLVAEARLGATMAAADFAGWEVVRTLKGADLQNLVFGHPLFDRASPIVMADYVTTDDGTGLVHTAPGHGKDDFVTGQKYGLPIIQVLTGNGYFNEEAGPDFAGLKSMAGKKIGPGQERVLERLTEEGALLASGEMLHSFPHGWRSHDPLVVRATVQWFVSIDHDSLRKRSLDAIDGVEWFPADSKNRITAMVANRPDWCISRQRAWGVGIPVFYAQPSGTPLVTPESIGFVRDLVAREGTDAWFERPVSEILPAGYEHPETKEVEFTKETDIFDVWFDSGSTCRTVLEQWPGLSYPADVYLEGGDQHRGWFNASLMIGMASTGHAPFRQVVTNGWTLDAQGRAFSKSLGNGIPPQTVIDKYGADVLRLWVCSTDYFADVRIGDVILDQMATAYRTLRNTLRFTLGNLNVVEPRDFDVTQHAVGYSELPEIDRWILHRLNNVVRECMQCYHVYEFPRITQAILNFCNADLSAFYLDILKDRLYAHGADSFERRAAQTVLFEITSTLARLLAPIISFTAEEVWQKLNLPDKPVSVLLAAMPSFRPELENTELDGRWCHLLAARNVVNLALEGTKKRLELAITLTADTETYEQLYPYLNQLPGIFLVSRVTLQKGEADGLAVSNDGPAVGVKCGRCWVAVTDGGDDPTAVCAAGCVRSWRVAPDGAGATAARLLPE